MNTSRLAISLALLLGLATGTAARQLSPEEALARLSEGGMHKAAALNANGNMQLVGTFNSTAGTPAVYAFDRSGGKGFVLVSADDCVRPLLGYSDSGSLQEEMPPQLKWWLEEYGRQIEYSASQSASKAAAHTSSAREAIAPMLKTAWDQSAPFNNLCPKDNSGTTFTGCVATAMAQVMKYWEYPEKGKGQISYDAETLQKRLSMNFSLKKFDWANMLPSYTVADYTDEQAEAVAYLMKACGYSVKMDYGTESSGALALMVSRGLTRYFDYDPNAEYTLRSYYSTGEWEELIYNNLREVGPVVYGGSSQLGGGHCFVCDGYDGEGFFHFNWGWSGISNGYFALDALNPESLGSGGGSGGGYNFTQEAVLGIRPSTGEPAKDKPEVITQVGSLGGYVEGSSLKLDLFAVSDPMWVNYNPTSLTVSFGAIFEKNGAFGSICAGASPKKLSIKPGYGTSASVLGASVDLSQLNLEDGSYKVTMATRYSDDGEWIPVRATYGHFNYLTLTKNGDTYTVVNNDVEHLQLDSAEIVGNLYYGMTATVKISVRNSSDHQMSSGFAPCFLYNGTMVLLGESIFLTVDPGKTVTREWTTPLTVLSQYFIVDSPTKLNLTFFDESTFNYYDSYIFEEVTMNPNPGAPDIVTTANPVISGAEVRNEIINGRSFPVAYAKNKYQIDVESGLMLRNGIFSYPVYAFVVIPGEEGASQLEIGTMAGNNMKFGQSGESQNFSTTLSYPAAKDDQLYLLMVGYANGSNFVQIGPHFTYFRIDTAAGIENADIASGTRIRFTGLAIVCPGEDIEVFNLQGIKVAQGFENLSTAGIAHGNYIVRAAGETVKLRF